MHVPASYVTLPETPDGLFEGKKPTLIAGILPDLSDTVPREFVGLHRTEDFLKKLAEPTPPQGDERQAREVLISCLRPECSKDQMYFWSVGQGQGTFDEQLKRVTGAPEDLIKWQPEFLDYLGKHPHLHRVLTPAALKALWASMDRCVEEDGEFYDVRELFRIS